MKAAVAQFAATMDKAVNLEHIAALSMEAAGAGARLLVFPEGAMCDFGEAGDDVLPYAESLDGRFVETVTRLAARHAMTIVAGMFEAIPGDGHVFNTAVVVDPARGLTASYRKRQLFDAFGERESDRFRIGDTRALLFDLEGFTAAVAICYDVRFPAFIQDAADRGADVLLLPAAWVAGPLKEDHWDVMVRARAMENTMYVAGAGQAGTRYCAHSMIVDPLGVAVASLAEREGVAVADVSRERLDQARARLPLVAQRRAQREAESGYDPLDGSSSSELIPSSTRASRTSGSSDSAT